MVNSESVIRAMLALALAACSGSDTPSGGRNGTGPGSGGQAAAGMSGSEIPGGVAAGSPTGGSMGSRAPGGGPAMEMDAECGEISQTAENRRQPADIIFAIDNSGSMDEEIVFVRENMNAFSQRIVDSGIDARIIVVSAPVADGPPPPTSFWDDDDDQDNGICIDAPLGSGSCPADSNLPSYLHVPQEVRSHDALNLFETTFISWRSQLRPNATKTFVVVTDDNAEDAPNDSAAAFNQTVMNLDPMLFSEWTFSGIFCFSECPEAAEIGTVYMDLVGQTGGVSGDLCLQDFEPVFDALAQAVIGASGLDCKWEIPAAPRGETFDKNRVNVQYTAAGSAAEPVFNVPSASECDARGGWYYDDNAAPTHLLACPATCDVLQANTDATLDVLFGCATRGPD